MLSSFAVMFLDAALAAAAAQTPCGNLKSLPLSDATITIAELIPAGPYKPEAKAPSPQLQQPAPALPAYCRVVAVLKPSSDSNIEMEIWLPFENWNGKFQAVGSTNDAANFVCKAP